LDKRRFLIFLTVMGLGVAMMLFWAQSNNTPQQDASETQPAATTQPASASQPASPPSASQPGAMAVTATQPAPPAAPAQPSDQARWLIWRGPESSPVLGSLEATPEVIGFSGPYKFRLDLTGHGGAIESLRLSEYFETVADKMAYKDNPEEYQALRRKDPSTYKGHYQLLSREGLARADLAPMATRRLTVWVDGQDEPVVDARDVSQRTWQLADQAETDTTQTARYELRVYRDENPTDTEEPKHVLTLAKTYTVRKDDYSIDVRLAVINHSSLKLRATVEQLGPIGVPIENYQQDSRLAVTGVMDEGQLVAVQRTSPEADKVTLDQPIDMGSSDAADQPVVWNGLVNKYFGSMLYVQPKDPELLAAAAYSLHYRMTPIWSNKPLPKSPGGGRLWMPSFVWDSIALPPASPAEPTSAELTINLFAGPKSEKLFRETPLYDKLRYVDTIETRSCVCPASWIDWLRKGLMWMLDFFARHLFFGNFGLAIILLVMIVRVLLHPLAKYSQVSMAKMQKQMAALKPQMDKLKEKYANDKQALNAEMMKLYKEHGNPMSGMLGCLPMLLQMPIWVALFSGLRSQVTLRHAAFLPVWITDLASPDQLISWQPDVMLIGHSFNLLPILLAVAMYFQAKMNPSMSGSANISPEQEQQQKMMRYMMPGMMLLFFYNMPSGLNLYIMTSTFVGAIESHVIRKHIREKQEAEDAAEVIVRAPGKADRDNRPKKPKGPFWTKRG
jgi:YidC/Oxa1 family membrane protein insertase